MAVDIIPVYSVLISIFGGVALAIIGVGIAITIILIITKNSWTFTAQWLMFYAAAMIGMYIGGIGLVLIFALSAGLIVGNIIAITMHQYT